MKGEVMARLRARSSDVRVFSVTGTLYAVFVTLYFLVRKPGSWGGRWKKEKFVWIPLGTAFGMFALVHVEPRFVGGFGLMLLMRLLAAVRVSEPAGSRGDKGPA